MTAFLQAIVVFFLSKIVFGDFSGGLIVILGMVVGILIGVFTEYYTAKKPVTELAKSAPSGSAPLIINGLALGMNQRFSLFF